MISPPKRSASASARALFPVAVGPRTATTSGFGIRRSSHAEQHVDDEHEKEDEKSRLLRSRDHRRQTPAAEGLLWGLVVEKRHREERLVRGIGGGQRLRRVGGGKRAVRGAVERRD